MICGFTGRRGRCRGRWYEFEGRGAVFAVFTMLIAAGGLIQLEVLNVSAIETLDASQDIGIRGGQFVAAVDDGGFEFGPAREAEAASDLVEGVAASALFFGGGQGGHQYHSCG